MIWLQFLHINESYSHSSVTGFCSGPSTLHLPSLGNIIRKHSIRFILLCRWYPAKCIKFLYSQIAQIISWQSPEHCWVLRYINEHNLNWIELKDKAAGHVHFSWNCYCSLLDSIEWLRKPRSKKYIYRHSEKIVHKCGEEGRGEEGRGGERRGG